LEIFLHIGAHRTGTTSLQANLSNNRKLLRKHRLSYWGPKTIRKGLFAGMFSAPSFRDSDDKVKLVTETKQNINHRIEALAQRGQSYLLISDENVLGSMKSNLRQSELYPDLFMRLTHFSSIFGKDCSRVGISIRQYDSFWSSCIAYSIKAGYRVPSSNDLARLCGQTRTWRDVILEVSEMFPNAKILVWEFDNYAGKTNEQMRILTGLELDFQTAQIDNRRHNASPNLSNLRKILLDRGDGVAAQSFSNSEDLYKPFSSRQIEHLRENYLRDIDWLKSGAEGSVTFFGSERETH